MNKYTISNIDWDVSTDEQITAAFALNDTNFTETFGIAKNNENAKDIVLDKIRHMPALIDQILDLPETVEIPKEVYDACIGDENFDAATEYLSQEYGYFINGYTPNFSLS